MAVNISLFNHKGGVSKTTTAFNLGWMIACKNKRVMLVDCDPQCNLTGMVLGYKKIEDANSIVGSRKSSKTPSNIYAGLAPAFESRPEPIKPVDCVNIPGNENLILLPGHIGLAEYEVTLGIAQELSGSLVTLRNLPGSLRHLIEITAVKHNADYAIIDMSPSLGPVNQNLLMSSEFFLVPMHPDYFSSMGVDSLATVLPKWKHWSEQAQKLQVLKDAEYPFKEISPKFLGSIVQKYRPRGNNIPAAAFQHWIDDLQEKIAEILLPALRKADMMLSPDVYAQSGFSPDQPILQMSEFNSLIARSQQYQVPIYALTDAQLEQGGVVLKRTKDSMFKFKDLFSDAADRVVKMVENVTSTH